MSTVTIEIDRPEDYEDVCDELVLADFLQNADHHAWNARLVPPASTGQWKDIESAPHETLVLLFTPADDLYGAMIETGFASQGNRVRLPDGGWASTRSWHGTATHWMPHPPPPGDRTSDRSERDESLNHSEKD